MPIGYTGLPSTGDLLVLISNLQDKLEKKPSAPILLEQRRPAQLGSIDIHSNTEVGTPTSLASQIVESPPKATEVAMKDAEATDGSPYFLFKRVTFNPVVTVIEEKNLGHRPPLERTTSIQAQSGLFEDHPRRKIVDQLAIMKDQLTAKGSGYFDADQFNQHLAALLDILASPHECMADLKQDIEPLMQILISYLAQKDAALAASTSDSVGTVQETTLATGDATGQLTTQLAITSLAAAPVLTFRPLPLPAPIARRDAPNVLEVACGWRCVIG
jgi:hypothetical protein